MRRYIVFILIVLSFSCLPSFAEDVEIWYGHVDSSPVWARPGEVVLIDVYARTQADVYAAGLGLCLGVMDQYVDSLCSIPNGLFYPPINQWDDYRFLGPQHCPPNQSGWSSQGFLGWADEFEPWGSPRLHSDTTQKIMTMAIRVVNDLSFLGDTALCLSIGLNLQWGAPTLGIQ